MFPLSAARFDIHDLNYLRLTVSVNILKAGINNFFFQISINKQMYLASCCYQMKVFY